jgi:hypothetical protein
MARVLLATILLCAPLATLAADDVKINQLEQDVLELKRELRAQAQQLERLRAQIGRPGDPPTRPAAAAGASGSTATWLDASRWRQLRTGMTELEVIGVLGTPTSMRDKGADRVLLYALEIGTSGYLAGSVTLRDRIVAEVQSPVLK